jgi:hypothetical protein
VRAINNSPKAKPQDRRVPHRNRTPAATDLAAGLRGIFLDALEHRVERDLSGDIVTPTGRHSAEEIARVLAGIRQSGRR